MNPWNAPRVQGRDEMAQPTVCDSFGKSRVTPNEGEPKCYKWHANSKFLWHVFENVERLR